MIITITSINNPSKAPKITVGLFCEEASVLWRDNCGFLPTYTSEVALSVILGSAAHIGWIVMMLFINFVLITVSVVPEAVFV